MQVRPTQHSRASRSDTEQAADSLHLTRECFQVTPAAGLLPSRASEPRHRVPRRASTECGRQLDSTHSSQFEGYFTLLRAETSGSVQRLQRAAADAERRIS